MDIQIKNRFLEKWEKYFGDSELPIVAYYCNEIGDAEEVAPARGHSRLICELARVRKGKALSYDKAALGCGGAQRYLFRQEPLSFSVPMPKFAKMIGYMDECFLITGTWKKVSKRIRKE